MDYQIIWIPFVLAGLAIYFWVRTYRASKSGSKYQNQKTGKWEFSDTNVPFYKAGFPFYAAIVLTVVAIGSFIIMMNDR